MAGTGRLSLDLPAAMVNQMREIAERKGTTLTQLTRVAYNLLIAAEKGAETGDYLGLARDPTKLDTRLLHIL